MTGTAKNQQSTPYSTLLDFLSPTRYRSVKYYSFTKTQQWNMPDGFFEPYSINLERLKDSRDGIIPTISIGLGIKNPDVFLFGAGYVIRFDRPIYFAALNLSWIGPLIK